MEKRPVADKMFPYDKERIQPFADKFAQMEMMLRERTDEELESLLEGCGRAAGTNCWYHTYRAAQWLKQHVKEELQQRANERAAHSANPQASETK